MVELDETLSHQRLYLDEDLPQGAVCVRLLPDGSILYVLNGQQKIITATSLITGDIGEVVLWSTDQSQPVNWHINEEHPAQPENLDPAIRLGQLIPDSAGHVILDPEKRSVTFFDILNGPQRRCIETDVVWTPHDPCLSTLPVSLN